MVDEMVDDDKMVDDMVSEERDEMVIRQIY